MSRNKKGDWSTYDYSVDYNIPEVAIRINLLSERLKEINAQFDAKVLEVGIGSGDVTLMLTKHFKTIDCIDSNKDNFSNISRRLGHFKDSKINFIHSKIEDANIENKKYDHIILLGILEHLKDPISILKKISENLDKDGRMYIVVNLANSLHRLMGIKMGMIKTTDELSESDYKLGHYRIYTLPTLRDHILSAGLNICYEQPFYLKPLPTQNLADLNFDMHKALDMLGREYPEFASYIYMESNLD